MSEPETAIRLKDVSVNLAGNEIFSHVDASIPRGLSTAIVGPNGAGKTTLTLAILHQLPFNGSISFPCFEAEGRSPRFGFVPQVVQFDRSMPMTTTEYLLSGIQRLPLFFGPSKRLLPRIHAILDDVECLHLADRRFGALSGGEIQRVLLAQALLQEPDILILDEPTSGVDLKGGRLCCELLRRIREKRAFTQIMICHDLAIVTAHADFALCMNHGLIAQGRPREVLSHQVLAKTFGLHLGLPDIHGLPDNIQECSPTCPLAEEHAHLHDHCRRSEEA